MLKFRLPAVLALSLSAGAAQAHVVFAEPQAVAGSHWVGALRVGHGCDGSATTRLRVEIPPAILVAKPRPKPGWTVQIEREALAAPVAGEGGRPVTERVRAITWTGVLADEAFDVFELAAKLPAEGGELVFPVVQSCEAGALRWTDPPLAGGARSPQPAPILRVRPVDAPAHH